MALAAASHRRESPRRRRAIGDGAMSAGQAFEALNHAGAHDLNMHVVLKHNDKSISENVGALSNYFARVLSGKTYAALREGGKKFLRRMPTVWELARRSEEHMKGMVLPGTLFEEMGFNYFGPIDGHDMDALVKTLRNLRDLEGPQLLHIVTRKGKGYAPAEADPIKWHGPGPYDPVSGIVRDNTGPGTARCSAGCAISPNDPRVVGITPAMRRLGARHSRNGSRIAISMSALPSSMP
jgi:1-deoxy-D-xylulose-5-phosphate synthase